MAEQARRVAETEISRFWPSMRYGKSRVFPPEALTIWRDDRAVASIQWEAHRLEANLCRCVIFKGARVGGAEVNPPRARRYGRWQRPISTDAYRFIALLAGA